MEKPDSSTVRGRGAYVTQVIITNLRRIGLGKDGDPLRIVTQIWTLDGTLIAEIDPDMNES